MSDSPTSGSLWSDRSFWGITTTQFLGAFNDNFFKQLMLLLAIPIGVAAATEEDNQGLATAVFSFPFVFFSGFAGYLADRYSKRTVIVISKVAEIVVMLLGLIAFVMYPITGYYGLLVVLFLMGSQSAFFGPGKYGILPELFTEGRLAKANGIVLMTTFLAIIFGTAMAGQVGDLLIDDSAPLVQSAGQLWKGSLFCIVLAVIGTVTSVLIRRVRASQTSLRFDGSMLIASKETCAVLFADRPLMRAMLASCFFWFVSGLTIPAINSFGLVQMNLSKTTTSLLTAGIAIGICFGAPIAGSLAARGHASKVVRVGAWSLVVFLMFLGYNPVLDGYWLGFAGAMLIFVMVGFGAAFFAIPVQVFIQSRPPSDQKGRMIALMNITNFAAIFVSGPVYTGFDRVANWMEWQRCTLFALMAICTLPVALYYRPSRDWNCSTKDDNECSAQNSATPSI